MEKRQKQEEIIAERAKMDKIKRATAVVLLQAGVRGYLTRKKTAPELMAAREKTRLERDKERERTRMVAATSIQAIWKGYRYSASDNLLNAGKLPHNSLNENDLSAY